MFLSFPNCSFAGLITSFFLIPRLKTKLKRLEQHLHLLKNPNTNQAGHFKLYPLNVDKGDYVLVDEKNKDWFPVHEEIPELLKTNLIYPATLAFFKQHYAQQIADLGLPFPDTKQTEDAQEAQREHYDKFAQDEKLSYDDYENLPFWIAVDREVKQFFNIEEGKNDLVLDLGCGNGRSIERFIPASSTVIGIDISREMLKKAMKRPKASKALLMIGDGSNPPFIDNAFDYCITSGVLSNFPDSAATCQAIYKMLKVNGMHLALENNKSIFRLPFDIMNKFFSIWKNVKGKEPEMNLATLKGWYKGCNIAVDSQSFCYLPPQAFSKTDVEAVQKKLQSSNKFFRSIGLGTQGGLIQFKVKKIV